MSASLSPEQYSSHQSLSPGDGSDGKSPVGLNLDFFKNLNDKRSNRDGKTPKRRGPKPDSKPALTRRQELNRQAQRTHRERKELYIKALEDEVLRLKEIYSSVSRDREKLAEENRLLKDTLVRHGINVPGPGNGRDDNNNNPSAGSTGFGGGSQGSFSPRQTPSHGSAPSAGGNYTNQSQFRGNQYSASPPQHIPATKLDVEQAGIDFVLALEKPCMAHLPFLMDRASGPEGEPCGHALMASCPPTPFKDIPQSTPFAGTDGTIIKKEETPSQGTWQVTKADLSTLMDLSKRLDLDGEITPVMAWGMIMSHPQFSALSAADVQRIAEDLGRKVRCYGFGAVMEDFELRDAFESLYMMADSLDYVKVCGSCPSGDGWGPAVTTETTLDGVPYAPFSKGDKLGRMADWTAEGKDRERGGRNQYNRNFRDQQVYGSSHAVTFNAPPAEDESTFSVVSNARDSTKSRYGRGAVFTRGRGARGGARTDTRGGRGGGAGARQAGGRQGYGGYERGGRGGGRGGSGRRFGWRDYDKPARNRDASINIKGDWGLLEEIDFNRLGKLNLDTDAGEDLEDYGFLYYYDRSYDKQPVKGAEKKLTALDRAAYNVTTSSDPVIQELADKDEATIFATDTILSMLMCSTRSVYPWDIVITRQGRKLFLDKRDNASLDMVTVNENAVDAPLDAADGGRETINQPAALAEEATYINHNFVNQVVTESETAKVAMAAANPFYNASEDTDPPASRAYKYRRFDLSTNDEEPVYLVVRTEVDAVQKNAINGEDQHMTIRALNEFDSRAQGSGGALDWRAKLVSQRGAVVATEMKNNSCKLARWTVQSILSKSDIMKIGFVSRVNPRSNDKHVILGVIGWKPRDFAAQMNLSLSNGWGIVRTIADMCLKHEGGDGKFVLLKDPNKSILRLYDVPAGSLDEEDEEGDDDDAEDAEENDE